MKRCLRRLFTLTVLVLAVIQSYSQVSNNEQLQVRAGKMDIEVKKYDETKKQVDLAVNKRNGLIMSEAEENFKARKSNVLRIRVPNKEFSNLLSDISSLSLKVETKSVEMVDVQKEIDHLTNQISSKNEIKNRYVSLLSKSKLNIEIEGYKKDIGNIEKEIRQLEMNLAELSQVEYSTLSLYMYQSLFNAAPSGTKPEGGEFSEDKVTALIKTVLIFSLIPIVLMIALYLLYRYYRKQKRKRRKTKTGEKSPW
jgi:preprotein translocase subunit SecG